MRAMTKAGIITLVAGASTLGLVTPAQADEQSVSIIISYTYHSHAGVLPQA